MAKVFLSIVLALACLSQSLALPTPASSKINPALRKSLSTKTNVNVVVTMAAKVEAVLEKLAPVTAFATRGAHITSIKDALEANAAQSQKSVLEMLTSPRFFYTQVESLWITNQIAVFNADLAIIEKIAEFPEVESIDEEEIVYLDDPVEADPSDEQGIFAEWGVEKIQAPQAWAAGANGAGAVVGVIDTGARYTHTAISGSYRGGTHSWFNPYTQTQNPGDGNGHGTHCTGTIAGSQASGIGVAPGAKWISCKGLQDNGSGGQTQLTRCGQFMLCPTTYTGGNADCNQAPHAVSNSWGGGSGQTWFNSVITSWVNAGIVPVFAIGNSGPSCGTANSPGDSTGTVISVGATTSTDAIASFSSRGPASGSRQKPEVSAPGNQIRSAGHTSDTAYATLSGTSMACPHVAGLVALIKGRNPNATPAAIRNTLQNTTDRNLQSGGQTCSGRPDNQFPNYTFGYGRVNALRAVQA